MSGTDGSRDPDELDEELRRKLRSSIERDEQGRHKHALAHPSFVEWVLSVARYLAAGVAGGFVAGPGADAWTEVKRLVKRIFKAPKDSPGDAALSGKQACRYPGCTEAATERRVRQLSTTSSERRDFCELHAAAVDLGDDHAWSR